MSIRLLWVHSLSNDPMSPTPADPNPNPTNPREPLQLEHQVAELNAKLEAQVRHTNMIEEMLRKVQHENASVSREPSPRFYHPVGSGGFPCGLTFRARASPAFRCSSVKPWVLLFLDRPPLANKAWKIQSVTCHNLVGHLHRQVIIQLAVLNPVVVHPHFPRIFLSFLLHLQRPTTFFWET
jgi:hypothetical protein